MVGIFFFPNVIGNYLLRPAMAAIYPTFSNVDQLTPHISAWHNGVNTAASHDNWRSYYRYFYCTSPCIIGVRCIQWGRCFGVLTRFIIGTLKQMESSSTTITDYYMSGHLRDYLTYIFGFFPPCDRWKSSVIRWVFI